MPTIQTKYLGPTNHLGARVKATDGKNSVTVSWDHALSSEKNHNVAAGELAIKMGWEGPWASGPNVEGSGNVYVLAGLKDIAFHIGIDLPIDDDGAPVEAWDEVLP